MIKPMWYSPLMDLTNLKSLNTEQTKAFVRDLGWPAYRADQILKWIYQKNVTTFSEMTDLSQSDRLTLEEKAYLSKLNTVRHLRSTDGTEKFLFQLSDGKEVESVLIPGEESNEPRQRKRVTLCISTQVGCTLDCTFCLTGTMGLIRNLAAHEIVEQILEIKRAGHSLTNVVLMGMGEPLANYNEVIEALNRLTNPKLLGFSPRRITLSTSGLVPQIKRFGESGLNVNLAISLNATTDSIRNLIMPAINRLYPIKELLDACRCYPLSPRRYITFEYVLIEGLNDTQQDAKRLLRLLEGIPSKVNLIRFNDFPGAAYRSPSEEKTLTFQEILVKGGLTTFIRKRRGKDILAACGQLRTEGIREISSMI